MNFDEEEWLPIPQAPRYVMNVKGEVRNVMTDKMRRWSKPAKRTKTLVLYIDKGKQVCVTLPGLLWLMFGKKTKNTALPVTLIRGGQILHFSSCRTCAMFLSRIEHYSLSWTTQLLAARRKEIFGWKVKYLR